MNPLGIFFMTATTLLAAGADLTEAIRKDKAALHGTWKVIGSEENGEKVPAVDIKDLFLLFKDDEIVIREGGKTGAVFLFQLAPTKKPKEIDLAYKTGPKKGMTDRGIYQIDGDTLTICIQSNKGTPRPRDFATQRGSNLWLVVLQRTKE